jgi:hypothetical protein
MDDGLNTGGGCAGVSAAAKSAGHAVVTVLPKREGAAPASVANQDLSVKVNGKMAKVTAWTPLRESANPMELVLLIDGSARTSLGLQMDEIKHFINSLPPNTKAAIAYMQNGSAVFAAPLTVDHAQVLRTLHLPAGPAGSSASPYFCLSDLAKHWPSKDETARRMVVMITDGVDYYEMRYDPEDPYVQTAINDSVRARLVVYSIYCENRGRAGASMYENFAGQNLLQEVSEATGGESYWQGMGNPVSYEPYFNEMTRRFRNQYELGFTSLLEGKPRIESLKLTLSAPGNEVDTPQKVLVVPMEN